MKVALFVSASPKKVVIELVRRVTTVDVETMEVMEQMRDIKEVNDQ
jgi:hypothetical protein